MTAIRFALIGLVLAAGVAGAQAQRPAAPPPQGGPGEIRGIIQDENSAPVARASVAIRSARDSSLVAGGFADDKGAFRIQGLRPGSYRVRVTMLGFRPHVQELAVTEAAPRVGLGTLTLARVAVALQGVEVTEARDAVSIEPDRNSYRSKDVAPAATNASEVLESVPAVQVDGDGKVSLRGNENVAVQINGRPSPLRGQQLASYLKSLPSNIVERVEVIPNPSAKYDPEGMAGIINIVLKQNVDLGLSAGLNLAAANAQRYNGSGNVGWQRGPLTLFASYGRFSDQRGIFGINDRERYDAFQSLRSVTEQDVDEENGADGHNLYTSADLKLGKRDVLTNALTVNMRQSGNAMANAYAELDDSRALLMRYDRRKDASFDNFMFDWNTAFKRTFEPQKHELGLEARFTRSRDEEENALWRQPRTSEGAETGAPVERESTLLDARTNQLNAQADYTKAFAARTKLEAGYKATARWLDRDYDVAVDPLGDGSWSPSPRSNAFSFDETVHALYGVLSKGAGKFDLQAGLRAELAGRDFVLPEGSYPHDYASLFPSGVVLYNLTDKTQLKASYSRRIRRPGTQELNPFPFYFDVQNVFLGNPLLDPEYTDAFEFGYTRSGKFGNLQVSPFYRRTTDVIRAEINTADTLDGREVTSVSFKNLATSNSWGTDVNTSLRLGQKLSGFAGFNVFRIVTDGGSESTLSSDAVTWAARVNATSQLTKTFSVQGSYFYRAPLQIEGGKFSAQQQASFSLRQKVRGESGALTLRVQDPFNTGRFRIRAGDDNVVQITERHFGVRAVFLGFQFNYGQAPRLRQQPQQQQQGGQPGFPTG